ncbi:MAG: hypothetical protein JO269_09790 [Burkholderiaceae bacterium]|nr:hypothetical protein [Burkholderiaceae bacterium]
MEINRDLLRETIAIALADIEAVYCTRTESAWSYGTMGPDDFFNVANDGDKLDYITDAVIAAMQKESGE